MKIHAENANPGICQIDFLYKTGLLQFCQNDIFAGISPGCSLACMSFFHRHLGLVGFFWHTFCNVEKCEKMVVKNIMLI